MTEEQKEDIKLLKELIADTSIPNDDREIYQEALNQILAETKSDMPKAEETKSDMPKVAKEKMPKKEKATPKTKPSKKPKAEKTTPLPSDVDAMKKAIKERTGKTEAECEDIIAQYRKLRAKAKVNNAKRTEKLKSNDDLITGTNVITPVAQIEKDAEIVKAKIEKQVEQIENKAEREVVKKDKTKDEVKVEVEQKVVKQLAKLSDDMVSSATTFVKNIQTELKKVDKTEAKNFLLGLRNEIDALLSKFGDGGDIPKVYEVGIDLGDEGTHTIANFDNKADAKKFIYDYQLRYPKAKLFIDSVTSDFLNSQQKFEDGGTIETYNITENESASSVNPTLFARGGGVKSKTNSERIKALVKNLDNTPYSIGLAILRERLLTYTQNDLRAMEKFPDSFDNPIISRGMYKDYFNRVIEELKFDYEDGGSVDDGDFAKGGGVTKTKTGAIKLYYHQTSGGAEYLSSSKVKGTKDEGSMDSEYIVRIDGAKDFGGELFTKVLPNAKGGGVDKFNIAYIDATGIYMGKPYDKWKLVTNLLKKHNIEVNNSKEWGTKGYAEELYEDIDGESYYTIKLNINDSDNPELLKKQIENLPRQINWQFTTNSGYKNGGEVGDFEDGGSVDDGDFEDGGSVDDGDFAKGGGIMADGRIILRTFNGIGMSKDKTYNVIKDDRDSDGKPYYTLMEKETGKVFAQGDSFEEINHYANLFSGKNIDYARGGGVRIGSDGREYPFGSAWALEHNKHNKNEKYEIAKSSRKS